MADRDELKRAAAERAVEFVESGMVLGLGTGSTAAFFVEALAARVGQGLSVIAIPTSERTAAQAHRLGIPLGGFAEHRQIDIAIDGADEVQRTSLDLILGLPRQTEPSYRETLETAIATGAWHVSLYMLDLEEGTALARQVDDERVTLPDDDLVANLYTMAVDRFADAGLAQYEISNFARPGEECRHNLRYWRREHYLGFGIGAHSFIGDRRFANTRDIHRYIAGDREPVFAEVLGEGEVRRETIFLRLRQAEGIDYEDVVRLCGEEGIAWMDRGLSDGWLRRVGNRVAFTPSGFLLSNDYISQLF